MPLAHCGDIEYSRGSIRGGGAARSLDAEIENYRETIH
jgi:hypothetical protein